MNYKKYLRPDVELCSAMDEHNNQKFELLNDELYKFYNSDVQKEYFETAEEGSGHWDSSMTGHWHLRDSIPQGSSIVDLGCGTAHPCRNLHGRDIKYTGIDWSEKQVRQNQMLYPEHNFVSTSLYETNLPDSSFDVAISLYVIEHMVWPHRLLDEMYRLVKPGGLIGILCPTYRIKHFLKSFDYGLTARSFSQKLRSLSLFDVLIHAYQHRIYYPYYLKKNYPREIKKNRFLINMKPVCLQYKGWFPDADAVYLADTEEIAAYLTEKGGQLIEEWPNYSYVLVRKCA